MGWQVLPWNVPSQYNQHLWGHAYTWDDSRECMDYSNKVLDYVAGLENAFDNDEWYVPEITKDDLYFSHGTTFPLPLYRFTLFNPSTGEYSHSGFVTFDKHWAYTDNEWGWSDVTGDFDKSQLNGGDQSAPYASVDFWLLLEQNGWGYQNPSIQDIPRYHIIDTTEIVDIDVPYSYNDTIEWTAANPNMKYFEVGWNGVSPTLLNNTYSAGGYSSDSDGQRYVPWREKNLEDWHEFFQSQSPWLMLKKTITTMDGMTYPRGLLMPTVFYNKLIEGGDIFSGFDGSTGLMDSITSNYVTVESNTEGLTGDGEVRKVGLILTYEDLSADDIIESELLDSTSTVNLSGISVGYDGSGIDPLWEEDDVDYNFKGMLLSLISFAEVHGVNYMYKKQGNAFDENNLDLDWWRSNAPFPIREEMHELTREEGQSIPLRNLDTYYWSNPSQYNSIAISIGTNRFKTNFTTNPSYADNVSLPINVNFYNFNVTHRLDISNIKNKEYFIMTGGRDVASPIATHIIKDIINKELAPLSGTDISFEETSSFLEGWNLGFSIKEEQKILIVALLGNKASFEEGML